MDVLFITFKFQMYKTFVLSAIVAVSFARTSEEIKAEIDKLSPSVQSACEADPAGAACKSLSPRLTALNQEYGEALQAEA